ncbi:hypothetical protein ACFWP2_28885 [Kitasatospora sp. NPDC058444]|uniref:hypothetical protein n=1 Tax=Kitasatospora sp. NPDC058444 TaxID=3346504 RepID=UPI0036634BF3
MTVAATALVGIAFDGFTQARVRLTRTIEETGNLYAVMPPTMETGSAVEDVGIRHSEVRAWVPGW